MKHEKPIDHPFPFKKFELMNKFKKEKTINEKDFEIISTLRISTSVLQEFF